MKKLGYEEHEKAAEPQASGMLKTWREDETRDLP
jgi:hypothetical protein